MKIDNDGAERFPRAPGGGTSILDLPEDVCPRCSPWSAPRCCWSSRAREVLQGNAKNACAAGRWRGEGAASDRTCLGNQVQHDAERMRLLRTACMELKELQAADASCCGSRPVPPRLGTLDMRFNQLGDEGLMVLASASVKGWLPNLTVLGLSNNKITTGGAKALASAAAGCPPAFETPSTFAFNEIDGEGLASLALAMGDGALEALDLYLDGNKSDAEVVQQALLKPSNARLAAAARRRQRVDYIAAIRPRSVRWLLRRCCSGRPWTPSYSS